MLIKDLEAAVRSLAASGPDGAVETTKELKDCPCCGAPAMMFGGGTRGGNGIRKNSLWVGCSSRLCSLRTDEFFDKSYAVAIWNRRQ